MSTTTTDDSTNRRPTTRRIHRTLGRTTTFWRGHTSGELLLFAVPPLAGIALLGMPFVPSGMLMPLFGSVVGVELLLFATERRSPDHYRLLEWLAIRVRWRMRPSSAQLRDDDSEPLDVDETPPSHEDTRSVSRIRTVHPYGIERDDGALLGAVEISPANMALRDDAAWEAAANGFADLVDSSIDFQLQVFVTTTVASERSRRNALSDRLADGDVRERPALRGLISRYLGGSGKHTSGLDTTPSSSTSQNGDVRRRYFAVVAVDDEAVADVGDAETNEQGLPGLHRLSRLWGDDHSSAETESLDTKRRLLDERLTAVHRGVGEMPGCSATRVEPRALAGVIHDYWTGHTASGLTDDSTTGTPPTVTPQDGTSRQSDAPGVITIGSDDAAAVAPSRVAWERDTAVLDGEQYTRTFWVEQFPEHPSTGLLERLLLDTDLCADLSIHIDPIERDRAADAVADWISTLQTTRDDGDQFHASDTDDEIARAREIRDMIRKNATDLYRVGVFIRLSADSRDALRRRTRTLEALLRDAPANCLPKRVTHRPESGLATVSPIGRNELGSDRCSVMTGEAVGALFPFSSNYLWMDEGVEYGKHGHNESTVRIDPWELDTGHSELVTGTPGSGKTHGTQARCLRTLARHDDVTQVIVDPVGDMRGMARALGASEISIADATAVNPCALHPPSQRMRDTAWEMDPVGAKKEEVYALVENFLATRDADLDTHSGIITYAIDRIYERSAVDPDDLSTHTPSNSPTLADLLAIIDDLSTHPERHALVGDGADGTVVADRVASYAADLAIALEPFRTGSVYDGLADGDETTFFRGDDRVVYIDLQEIEGSTDGLGKQSFLMQLLLSQLYQQAKQTDDRVEIVIDEAHYLCEDAANLAFLNQVARHQRHAGLRLVLLSQTLHEFYDTDAAEEIASMCPIKIHHREPELDEATAGRVGLSEDQLWFVRNATAGNETTGYSEALVRVDEHGDYPLTITTGRMERHLIEEADRGTEPAVDDDSIGTAAERTRMGQLAGDSAGFEALLDRCSLDRETLSRRLHAGLDDDQLLDGLATAVEATSTGTDGKATASPEEDSSGPLLRVPGLNAPLPRENE